MMSRDRQFVRLTHKPTGITVEFDWGYGSSLPSKTKAKSVAKKIILGRLLTNQINNSNYYDVKPIRKYNFGENPSIKGAGINVNDPSEVDQIMNGEIDKFRKNHI